jgi:hypothetical protein
MRHSPRSRAIAQRLGLGALLALAISSGACGGAPRPQAVTAPAASASSAGPPAAASAASASTGSAPSEDGFDVALLTPGAEPRRAMRYVFHPGVKERMSMDMRMTIALSIGDKHAPPITTPPMVLKMLVDPERVTSEGNLLHDFVVESADIAKDSSTNPKLAEALERDLPKLVGLSGKAETTPRGHTLHASINVPPDVTEQVKKMLEQTQRSIRELTVPFPEEPVGRGARWSVTNAVHMNGMNVKRTASFVLSQLDGDKGSLAVAVVLAAPPQDVTDAQGARFHLESLNGKGQGSLRFDLARLVPTSEMEISVDAAMTVDAEGTKQPVAVNTKIGMRVTGAK